VKDSASTWLSTLCFSVLLACSGAPDTGEQHGEDQAFLAGSNAKGPIPTGLPARVLVGLFEDTGATWMKNSGVRWDARYRYLTKGWVNNWGFGAYDGSFALTYFRECDTQSTVPAVQYYQLFAEPGGGESATLQKVQNVTTMRSYFGDFKLLMQRAKDFGKPVMILLEADAFGFLQQQSSSNTSAPAAIASTGMTELQGLPNTVAGFGLAFLQLRKAVGANNAVLGLHISAWASGKDIAAFNVTEPLGPEVDKVYAFLSPLGLATNVTGQQFEVLVGDPLDRDADFYRLTQNQDRWWDASDAASISSRSFNRYAEWLRLWNVKAQKRWVLWQIPLGNSNSKNVYNNGGASEGYKDNRAEYFFGSGTAHIEKFAESGVIALLFGAGAGGQSTYTNDQYGDGQLFMKSRAGAIINAGGVPLSTPPSNCSAVAGSGSGLSGDYFSGTTLTTKLLTRTDATVDFQWGTAAPATGVPADNFSVRWTGQVSPRYSGSTTFYTSSDDGVRLWVNGQQLVNNWTNHGTTENSGSITLTAGQKYDIKLEYYEAAGGATARLLWSSACEPKAAVPSSQLYPPAVVGGDTAQYNFESNAQSWIASGAGVGSVARSTDRAFAGSGSLKVVLGSAAGDGSAKVANPAVPAGATLTFRVWIPSGSTLSAVQPYALQGAAGGWAWSGAWRSASSLQAGAWNTIAVAVPANAAPLAEIGVVFTLSGASGGLAAYVDSVSY
jgi:hypothetical protein